MLNTMHYASRGEISLPWDDCIYFFFLHDQYDSPVNRENHM